MIKQFEGLTLKQMDDVEYQINFCLDQMKSTDFSQELKRKEYGIDQLAGFKEQAEKII